MCLRLFLPVVTGLMVALTWAAVSGGADDQDTCRIGAVSPEEYRTIAAEIAALPAVDWQEIHGDPLGVSENLEKVVAAAIRDRIQAAIAPRASSDQKVAAMHAVLRSIGAEFAWVDLIHTDMQPDYRRVPPAWSTSLMASTAFIATSRPGISTLMAACTSPTRIQ
jgi:hypothetical protein